MAVFAWACFGRLTEDEIITAMYKTLYGLFIILAIFLLLRTTRLTRVGENIHVYLYFHPCLVGLFFVGWLVGLLIPHSVYCCSVFFVYRGCTAAMMQVLWPEARCRRADQIGTVGVRRRHSFVPPHDPGHAHRDHQGGKFESVEFVGLFFRRALYGNGKG